MAFLNSFLQFSFEAWILLIQQWGVCEDRIGWVRKLVPWSNRRGEINYSSVTFTCSMLSLECGLISALYSVCWLSLGWTEAYQTSRFNSLIWPPTPNTIIVFTYFPCLLDCFLLLSVFIYFAESSYTSKA